MRTLPWKLFWIALWAGLLTAPPVAAQWADRTFSYIAVNEDVREVLRDFAANQGLGVVISERVGGTISGSFQDMPPQRFMEEIAAISGLIWYLFAGVLYVYDSAETDSEIIYLRNTPPELLRGPLNGLGIIDPRFDWRADSELGIVVVTGPPRYTELVRQVISTIEQRRADLPGLVVIQLQYASAIDRTISYRNQQITVPGVASILRQLVQQGPSGVQRRSLPANVPPLSTSQGQALDAQWDALQGPVQGPAPGVDPTAQPTPGSTISQPSAPGAAPTGGQAPILQRPTTTLSGATIQSDPRLNAVIISASGDQLPFFQRLVEQLDIPSELIQIDVTIIDVAANRLAELGVQWEVAGGDFSAGISSLITPGIDAGLGVTGLIEGGTVDFAADVRALETVGDARIVSQPSLITFDSVEAVIDETESIYVRVAGQEDVDLFQIQTGTLLRVTPRLVRGRRDRDVELFVDIRDGNFDEERQVDDIPTVAESTLTTTAIVDEGQGLLLGGLYRTRSENLDEKVPVLGDIPVLGLAFRSKRLTQSSVVRLFLLTPRIVRLDASTGGRVDLPPGSPVESAFSEPGRRPAPPPGDPWPLMPRQASAAERVLPSASATACGSSSGRIPSALTYNLARQRIACTAGNASARPALRLTPVLPALY